jgi:hypothetical protein
MNEEEKKAVEILNTFELRRKTKNYKEISLEDSQSVEIVLNLIEKLQKENEVNAKFIPVQKIKDKIEELDIAILECEYSDDDDELYKKAVKEDKVCLLNQKRVLKELLKEEK